MRRFLRSISALLVLCAVAAECGGGAASPTTKPPDPPDSVAAKHDPYATIYVENTTTSAVGALHTSYTLFFVFLPDTAFPSRTALQGAVGPGERACTSLNGFTGEKQLALAAVTDTINTRSPDELAAAALGTLTATGLVVRTTGVFDPLISADTSRGHTRARPVKWRWTLSDAGAALVEDSTTICEFP